ncbi:MAG: hypothetical protein JKY48_17805 [Flavobacteriales bacterium]|nr:hypothetical protein [Flavobacteriales bacterium]
MMVFTFIGLPAAQSISSFSDAFNSKNLVLDITSEEEESERSKNETEEVENKLISEQENHATFQFNQQSAIMLHDHLLSYSSLIHEVSTPPPEFLTA